MRVAWLLVVTACGRLGFPPSDPPLPDTLTPDSPTGDGLVARYTMDEVPTSKIVATEAAFDAPCGPCPTSVPGRIGNAVAFDGTFRVALPSSTLIGLAPFTVSVWLRPALIDQLMSAVNKPRDLTSLNNTLSLRIDPDGRAQYETSVNNVIVEFPNTGADLRDAWHHLAASWDGATRRLHIDGVLAGEMPGDFEDSNLAVGIGADLDNGAVAITYKGDLDELRFYDRALTQAELTALANP